jgi:hypothetical protein
MLKSTDPASIVQRQLDAYNARDIDALMAIYAEDVEHYEFRPRWLRAARAKCVPACRCACGSPICMPVCWDAR